MARVLVSVHVPKTGGTALRLALSQRYRVQTYYEGAFSRVQRPQFVHGHMQVSQARSWFPDAPVIAFLRHPYGQVRSNYDHYRRAPDTYFDPDIGVLPSGMSFSDFISYPPLSNYQSRFLDAEVDFLGTTETMAQDVAVLNALYGLAIPRPTLENATIARTRLTDAHVAAIERHYDQDLKLYRALGRGENRNHH